MDWHLKVDFHVSDYYDEVGERDKHKRPNKGEALLKRFSGMRWGRGWAAPPETKVGNLETGDNKQEQSLWSRLTVDTGEMGLIRAVVTVNGKLLIITTRLRINPIISSSPHGLRLVWKSKCCRIEENCRRSTRYQELSPCNAQVVTNHVGDDDVLIVRTLWRSRRGCWRCWAPRLSPRSRSRSPRPGEPSWRRGRPSGASGGRLSPSDAGLRLEITQQ